MLTIASFAITAWTELACSKSLTCCKTAHSITQQLAEEATPHMLSSFLAILTYPSWPHFSLQLFFPCSTFQVSHSSTISSIGDRALTAAKGKRAIMTAHIFSSFMSLCQIENQQSSSVSLCVCALAVHKCLPCTLR